MAKYLAYTSPARGHLYPIVATLLELRERGHEVHVRTLASELPTLRSLGIHAEAIAPAIEGAPLTDWKGATPEEALMLALETFATRAPHEMRDLRRAITEVGPDGILVDITTVGAAAVAEAEGLPWAQSIPLFQHFSAPFAAPPSSVTLVPFALHPAGIEVLNAPRREVGLPLIEGAGDVWRAPLYLYYTALPFEADLEFPPSFRLVGPGTWDPPAQAGSWLDDLEEPLVVVTVSSEYQSDADLIETALEGLRSEPVSVVVTTAAHDPTGLDVPANARLARWLPHGALVRRAACVVCHGGMGITQRAIAAGVPVCVVPFGRDQFEVASRVTAVGAGTQVLPDALSPETLRSAVQQAMTMTAGAQRISEAFARAGGAPAAADELESQLSVGHVRQPVRR